MRRRPSPDSPLFDLRPLDEEGVRSHGDAIAQIHAGTFEGLVWKGAVDEERCARVLEGLDSAALSRTGFPMRAGATEPPYTLGLPLMLSPDADPYHREAERLRRSLDGLWGGDFEGLVERLLGRFAGGRAVRLAHAGGHPCAPATVRVLPPGNAIGAHVGNDFVLLPQAQRLADTLDIRCQLSWFVPLQTAEQGGELEVYGLSFDDTEPIRKDRPEGSDGMDELAGLTFIVDLADRQWVDPGPGDLVLFDGGRWYHRVRPVRGERARVTIGGFLAFSGDGETIYYWS